MSRIVILGGGESGAGAAVLAKVKGFDVFLSDKGEIAPEYAEMLGKWDIPYESGQHTEERILNADEVIKSPGIPADAPIVRKITEAGIHVISEIEFAGRYDKAKKICITGSNGKTTTTSLIYYLLQQAGLNVGLGGNIGKSYAYQVATEQHDIYVLEISSFQLDNMYDFKADIAIITNITPDHLDRYDHSIEKYAMAKFRITQNMDRDDCFIFCSDDEITIRHLDQIVIKAKMLPFSQKKEVREGAFLRGDRMVVRIGDDECDMFLNELALGGKHNVYNSMAAAIAGKVMDIDNDDIRRSLESRGMRKGFACLFHGAPGTGKTETVYQLAKRTGRHIMEVNVEEIKSMWVGASEKNIKAVFDRYRAYVDKAERIPILLFNEADAIIGKRQKGAERAVDKMENSIQNIILQEMERLDGILIATTNLAQNMDKAFERRFLYKIAFDKPCLEAKQAIWQSMLPELGDREARTLATRYDFSGGQIENVARKRTVQCILYSRDTATLDELTALCDSENISSRPGSRPIGYHVA